MITKVIKYTVLSLGLTFVLTSCDDLVEPALENQKDLEALEKEALSVQRLLENAYATLPAYYDNSDYATDDAVTNQKSNPFIKIATGGWTSDNGTLSVWPTSYAAIQYVNLFMQTREGQRYVKNEITNALLTRRLLGEAYGLRGIHLYYLLRNHAGFVSDSPFGVQLFAEALDINSDFNISRSAFEECVAKALEDLDQAVALLPFDYGDVTEVPSKFHDITSDPSIYNLVMGNEARQLVNGQIAESFRSRLLLLAASPAFSQGSKYNWADAANAAASVIDAKGGVSALPSDGITYYDGNNVTVSTEGANSKEIIWRSNRETNSTTQESNNYPPTLFGNGMMNPTQNLVDAFPTATGYPISDSRSGYDAQNPYANRDPRLDIYIIHDGSTAGVNNSIIRTGSKSGSNDGIDVVESKSTRTGYYMRKRLRMSVNCDPSATSGQDHITPRIRLTEIFLNYAEAANEAWGPKATGSHGYSAYDIIKAIRQRAGITDTKYLDECAADKDKMRQLIRNERRLELCFESFRFWDLRRWKADLNETARGLDVNETLGVYTYTPLNNVEIRAYQSYQNYGPIPQSEVLKYSNLKQNDGWK
ncbi:MAG: RagB/SusD family nutrient uptake outer membrane protein [Prevotella sp.]|jgi:hypothetical protein|nr:RagB/SusD family nutrient uptake outer membrane protein [Prevotella sp.]MBR3080567.1 RagB/SusD family nutrient uptake outer membrane protein [Prevotella sp.]